MTVNDLQQNPIRCDTAATIIDDADGILVQAMQWLDDGAAAIVNDDDLNITINGVSHQCRVQLAALAGGICWQVAFAQPVRIFNLVVAAIDGGCLYVWRA